MQKISSNSQTFTRALAALVLIVPLLSLLSYTPVRALSSVTGGGGDIPITGPITPPITPPDSSPSPTPPITSPTGSPTPSPSASPSPSPTPTNNVPVITTTSLPDGKVGVAYSAVVRAADEDTRNGLSMMATNLPRGLVMEDCSTKLNITGTKKIITCTIEGTPTIARTRQVNIVVADSKGGITSKTIPLTIN